jgi:hypothetical protein
MQVRTGTVSVTNGSPTVTGTDTTWNTGVQPGAMFYVRGDATPYYVASVVSNTQLALSAPYQGVTRGDQFYWITTSFTPARNYPIPENGDVDPALILSRAISEIDADMGGAGGGGGGSGVSKLGQLTDVSEVGVTTGDVLTRLSTGTYGFAPAASPLIDGSNLGTGAGVFAGKSGNALTFKTLKVAGGGTLTATPTDLTITVPTPGEANTASNVGSSSALAVFRQKTGVNLEFNGLRSGAGIALSVDSNDIVISATGGSTTAGEVNTASNLGIGAIQLFRAKTGVNLGFRTLTFDAAKFTTTLSTDGNTYTIGAVTPALSGLSDVSLGTPGVGQFLRYDTDARWKPATLPAPGIASVSADPAPSLGGNLSLNGKSIVGLRGGYSGMIERPKLKLYTLDIACPTPRQIASITAHCQVGTVNFEVMVDDVVVAGMGGQASGSVLSLAPTNTTSVLIGGHVQLNVSAVSPDVSDFSFTLAYQSA